MRARQLLQVSTVAALVVVSVGAIRHISDDPEAARRRLAAVFERISTTFVDSLPPESLYVRAARGLVNELRDPYAALYSPRDIASFRRQTIGDAYGGVGMEVTPQPGGVRITRVFSNTPAAAMGIQVGDRIVEVDGLDVRKYDMDQVTSRLIGTPGSEVRIAVERVGVNAPLRFSGKRAIVHVPAVPVAAMLTEKIGYIPLQHFSGTAAQEVAQAAHDLRARGASRLILDLRGNGGGDLQAAIGVSSVFLPPGATVVTVKQRGLPDEVVAAAPARTSGAGDTLAPMIVLVDDGTASASEIVAGALQDHDRALIVGTTSFGKGLVQSVYTLDGGWALKMTTGKWYTPSGRIIQRERKLDDEGRLVEVVPDSTERDSVKAHRPAFHSDHGRVVYGGGGITPDVIVSPDTLTSAEQRFVRSLGSSFGAVSGDVEHIALEMKATARPDMHSSPELRNELFDRIGKDSVRVPRATYDSASDFIDRWLERRVVSLAFGDSAWVHRSAAEDPQVKRAIELLRGVVTTSELVRGKSPPA